MIFYFSATGSCLYAARKLAEATEEDAEPISIPQEMRREGALAYQDEAIGIVYPIYGHMIELVRRWLGHIHPRAASNRRSSACPL